MKVILFIDLDETFFVADSRFVNINKKQKLGNEIVMESPGCRHEIISIINPQKIAAVIEQLYQAKGEVILWTSGMWPVNIGKILADNLPLSKETKDKFAQCECINVTKEALVFNLHHELISKSSKGQRFERWKSIRPEWNNCAFILIDNLQWHLQSCASKPFFKTVFATTLTEETAFYEETIKLITTLKDLKEPIVETNVKDNGNGKTCSKSDVRWILNP